jgi:hypothetical protein
MPERVRAAGMLLTARSVISSGPGESWCPASTTGLWPEECWLESLPPMARARRKGLPDQRRPHGDERRAPRHDGHHR